MRVMSFVKKHYEVFLVNFVFLGFIIITLLAQFGVHIEVDEEVDLVPVKTEYSNSTRYIKLEYERNAKKSFWIPASVVYGKAGEAELKDIIKDGDSIERNVFINTRSDKVIGVTKSGKSILSLYYYNSKMFRYGILILIICDIVIFLFKFIHLIKSQKTTNMSQYWFFPEDKKVLELNVIIFQLREFFLLYFFIILFCALFGSIYTLALLFAYLSPQKSTEGITGTGLAVGLMILFLVFVILPLAAIVFIRHKLKNKDMKNRVLVNAKKYLSNVGEDYLEQLQADLKRGLRFMKKHNLVLSTDYVIGSIAKTGLPIVDPIAIPKEQIKEIAYVYYTWGNIKYHFVEQEVYFRLKNGKQLMMPVNDRNNIGLTLKALEECEVPIKDITQLRYGSKKRKKEVQKTVDQHSKQQKDIALSKTSEDILEFVKTYRGKDAQERRRKLFAENKKLLNENEKKRLAEKISLIGDGRLFCLYVEVMGLELHVGESVQYMFPIFDVSKDVGHYIFFQEELIEAIDFILYRLPEKERGVFLSEMLILALKYRQIYVAQHLMEKGVRTDYTNKNNESVRSLLNDLKDKTFVDYVQYYLQYGKIKEDCRAYFK